MKLTIQLSLENDAFQNNFEQELISSLLLVVNRVSFPNEVQDGTIKDSNGNVIGSYVVEEDL